MSDVSHGADTGAQPTGPDSLAQGVICGPWALAFPFNWARSIVEEFELSAVPKAPVWFAGAANIEGAIVPVVDLALFINPDAPAPAGARRLLVGGTQGGTNEDALALLFSRIPQQLRYQRQSLDDIGGLPPALMDLCSGYGLDAQGQMYMEIDCERLMNALGDELQNL